MVTQSLVYPVDYDIYHYNIIKRGLNASPENKRITKGKVWGEKWKEKMKKLFQIYWSISFPFVQQRNGTLYYGRICPARCRKEMKKFIINVYAHMCLLSISLYIYYKLYMNKYFGICLEFIVDVVRRICPVLHTTMSHPVILILYFSSFRHNKSVYTYTGGGGWPGWGPRGNVENPEKCGDPRGCHGLGEESRRW